MRRYNDTRRLLEYRATIVIMLDHHTTNDDLYKKLIAARKAIADVVAEMEKDRGK